MTRETVCDSQGLILLIALSYLIMVCLQGIFSLNIFCKSKTKRDRMPNFLCAEFLNLGFWIEEAKQNEKEKKTR